jgi:hypothetical protein
MRRHKGSCHREKASYPGMECRELASELKGTKQEGDPCARRCIFFWRAPSIGVERKWISHAT